MATFIRRLVAAVLAAGLSAGMALAETVDVTFLLVNDIYKMSGKDRGGFARLAAVVKGERGKGGNVLYVHAGDAISPSLMSGFDQGEISPPGFRPEWLWPKRSM